MRFAWIREHRGSHPVSVMCRVLSVSRSGYYAWAKGRAPGPRATRRRELVEKVRSAYGHSRGTYGSPRVYRALQADGEAACENTVARVMREAGIRSVVRRRFRVRTTDAAHAYPLAPNVLGRAFGQPAPDRAWAADVTYVPTGEGWLYLAAVIDLCSRRVVGGSMGESLKAELCTEALEMALRGRRPDAGLVHHSDRGCQYACGLYRRLLAANGAVCSMSAAGDCYDNAVVESFFKTLKVELVYHHDYATRAEARRSIFEFIEVFYNRRRLHSSLGYLSPAAYEASLGVSGSPAAARE